MFDFLKENELTEEQAKSIENALNRESVKIKVRDLPSKNNSIGDTIMDLGISDDYKPSEGELNNLVYLTCKYTAGWSMRSADLQVCLMMAGGAETIVGPAGIENLVKVTCEYIWDHICGEPEEHTAEQFFEHIKPAIELWYASATPEERSDTN